MRAMMRQRQHIWLVLEKSRMLALVSCAIRFRSPAGNHCRCESKSGLLEMGLSGCVSADGYWAISILATPLEGHRRCGYPAIGVRFHPEALILRHGRTEFLPLFSGEFLENEVRKNGGKITGIFGSYIPK